MQASNVARRVDHPTDGTQPFLQPVDNTLRNSRDILSRQVCASWKGNPLAAHVTLQKVAVHVDQARLCR
jgi:hypothetical protein